MRSPLHVEIEQNKLSLAKKDYLKARVHSFLSNFETIIPGTIMSSKELQDFELKDHIQSIRFCDIEHDSEIAVTECELVCHVYQFDNNGAETDTITNPTSGEELSAASVWTLPNAEFDGLWENLIYDSKLKVDILRFVETALEFSERGVDANVICCNRVVLLHGPTGTGKTSLCRALAQKLAVRLSDSFPRTSLFEINAHSLFSKWFSESGKLVAKLFDRIREIVEDKRLLACVLVDEVESLAHARRSALAGLEPSDSIRAVNAVLTELDRLRRHPNVLVLTTSNVTGAIDVAFVDRADIKRRVGPPGERAAFAILRGCCEELIARGVVTRSELGEGMEQLRSLANTAAAAALSGRSLRRLPFAARALLGRPKPKLAQFVNALHAALQRHLKDMTEIMQDSDSLTDGRPS